MLLGLLLSTIVTVCASPPADPVVAIEHDGVRGFFVPSPIFREMEAAYETAPAHARQVEALEDEARALKLANQDLVRSSSTASTLARLHWSTYLAEKAAHEKTMGRLEATQERLVEVVNRQPGTFGYVRDLLEFALIGAAISVVVIEARR